MNKPDNKIAEKFFNRSIAFLEVAIISSKAKQNYLYSSVDFKNVTSYLLYHATELFLKFALFKDKKELITGHNIFHLHNMYKQSYNHKKYEIQMPFCKTDDIDYTNLSKKDIEKVKKTFNMSFEQQLKYPIDSKKAIYNTIAFVDTEYLEKYKKRFFDIFWLLPLRRRLWHRRNKSLDDE